VNFIKPTLQKFIRHNYIARWQDAQAGLAMSSLQEGDLLSHLDFAKNYTFQVQDEVQSEYYCSISVTFLIHITYRMVIDTNTNESTVLKETHFYVSDDKRHDNFFVQHCLLLYWTWLQEMGVTLKHYIVFSDGCKVQFKGCNGFYFVGRYPALTKGCSMQWNFFGTGHGKGGYLNFILLIVVIISFKLNFTSSMYSKKLSIFGRIKQVGRRRCCSEE
jgi:hypothetical protein